MNGLNNRQGIFNAIITFCSDRQYHFRNFSFVRQKYEFEHQGIRKSLYDMVYDFDDGCFDLFVDSFGIDFIELNETSSQEN